MNSLKVRQQYHEKKKIAAEAPAETKKGKGKQKDTDKNGLPKIIPGESLGDFNRRLEEHMRPAVTQAMKDANAKKAEEARKLALEKKERREAQKEAKRRKDAGLSAVKRGESDDEEEPAADKKGSSGKRTRNEDLDSDDESKDRKRGKTEFEKPAVRHSILDVMTAPPVLPKLKKSTKATPSSIFAPINRNPFNAGQQRILEEERERVIARYRDLKEQQREAREAETPKTKKR